MKAPSAPLLDLGTPVPPIAHARFSIGEVVRHRLFDFRGVVFDIDPVFANSEEWLIGARHLFRLASLS